MTSQTMSWTYAFHATRHHDRRQGDPPMRLRAGDRILSRAEAGPLERSLDRLVAILAVLGVRSW